jgi:hypothetical protein
MLRKGLGFTWIGVVFVVALLVAFEGAADWKVYVAADLGISGSTVDTDGAVTSGIRVRFAGSDTDASPLISGAVGIEIPMDELLPREWIVGDVRLPDWPVRFELEGAGLREYEFSTVGGSGDKFFTEVKSATMFYNTWVDVPMTSAYAPIQYLLGLGRQPRLRRLLDPASLYFGVGIGFHATEFDGTTNAIDASDDVVDFAWNAGAGLSYALTDRVSLSAGYRYVGLGEQTIDFDSSSAAPISSGDDVEFDPEIHEFRVQLRVRVFNFLSPWR